MNTTLEPTFETIAKSARFIKPVKKTNYAPLPCETGAQEYKDYEDEGIKGLVKRFPVINISFMGTTYYDAELKQDMPVFAAVDVTTGKVDSGDRMFVAGYSTDSKLNPKLENVIIEEHKKWSLFVIAGMSIAGAGAGCLISLSLSGISPKIIFPSICATIAGFLTKIYFNDILESKETIKSFSYTFQGVIPDDVRAIYHKEKSNFDSIHLICDAKNRWISETRPIPPPNPDPLLIGVKTLKSGKILTFLLAKFDLTPAEQYIIDEFAV
jgi:hypothetical protein